MAIVQKRSDLAPAAAAVRRLAFEVTRRAEAMGLIEPAAVEAGDVKAAVRRVAGHVRRAGIATAAAGELNNVELPPPEKTAALLQMMIAALEANPAPKFEWGGLARLFDAEQLGAVLGVSASSLKRYQSGERATPDAVAARLHFLALVVGDLAGSYNDVGIRRWFHRKRALLDGRAPAQLLSGEWDPDDPAPRRVRELARELVSLSAA